MVDMAAEGTEVMRAAEAMAAATEAGGTAVVREATAREAVMAVAAMVAAMAAEAKAVVTEVVGLAAAREEAMAVVKAVDLGMEAKAAAGRVGAAEAATAVVSIFDRSRRSR